MDKPEAVADLMGYVASPGAGYITGTIATIDGGIASCGSIIEPRPRQAGTSKA
jgi:hypothetical protein